MRLLVVTPEYPPHVAGGILKYYELMTAAWTAAGAEVSVLVATPFSEHDDYARDGVTVRFVPLDAVNRHAEHLTHLSAALVYRRWIGAGVAAADWVRSHADRFDVIETTDFGLLFAPLACLDDRPPLVVKLHGSMGQISEHEPPAPSTELDGALSRLTEAAVLPATDAMHAYSPSNAAEWEGQLGRQVTFVPAPLPLPVQPPVAAESEFAGVVIGRVQSWKGPEVLCRALRSLGPRLPKSVKIAWVGRDTPSGPGGQSMSAWLSASFPGIWGDRVVPLGTRTAAEVAALQAAARFVVVPSTWDTFNFALAEAMGLGCVTLGSTGAGASYLIDHGESGFRFAPDDPEALGELILDAYSLSDAARRDMGAAARNKIARALDPSSAASCALSALSSLRSVTRPSTPPRWVREFLQPDAARTVSADYLENVSIRSLANHLKARVTKKIVG